MVKIHDTAGQEICVDTLEHYSPLEEYMMNQGELVWVLLRHAKSHGIDTRLDSPVTDYWESDTDAGVVVRRERIAADCAICSDGLHSSVRLQVVGQELIPLNMGLATFRGYFRAADLARTPDAK